MREAIKLSKLTGSTLVIAATNIVRTANILPIM